MTEHRIFHSEQHFQPADGEPLRTVVTRTPLACVVAWHVSPGQSVGAHVHPHGQDTWTILSGRGQYQVDASGRAHVIRAGDVVVAAVGEVHGVTNDGDEPLRFISVVSPEDAGYEPLLG
jgi:quercetin dioxygenase-like cupin family protein